MKEDNDMDEHIITMSGYFEKLAALGQDLLDNLVATMLLGSLPESYKTLVTVLESRPEEDLSSSKDFFQEFNTEKGSALCASRRRERKVIKVHEIGSRTVKCVVNLGRIFEVNVRDVLYVSSLGSNLP